MLEKVNLKSTNNEIEDRGQNPFDNLEFETFGQTETPSVNVPGYRWKMDSLPTSDPSVNGMLWNDGGIIRVSGGGSLPTSDPGVAGKLWNSNGQVVLSGYTPIDTNPVGTYFPYAGSTAPTGYLLLGPGYTIGDASSTATYKGAAYEALFNICKTSWGNAGTETWASHAKVYLPDPTAASLVGVGTSTGFTTNETIAQGTKVDDQAQEHAHKILNSFAGTGVIANNLAINAGTTQNGLYFPLGTGNGQITAGTMIALGSSGDPRKGTTTHGKYLGTYYIIKY